MKASFQEYNFEKSLERLEEILKAADANYEEIDSIPDRSRLTYTNGFYINCSALFVDIRDSSKLPQRYRRPSLAKLYRSYISEVVAIMSGNLHCAEISIIGDGILGIFEGRYKYQIDSVFKTAVAINSLVDVLNCKLLKHNIEAIRVGLGMSYGRALMIKAGYSGSGINDVVWLGDVVNEASNLCQSANTGFFAGRMLLSSNFQVNLNDHNRSLTRWNSGLDCYESDAVITEMDNWVQDNCS